VILPHAPVFLSNGFVRVMYTCHNLLLFKELDLNLNSP